MDAKTADKMIARYVRGGGNPETGQALLADLVARHEGDNLDFALHYFNFTR